MSTNAFAFGLAALLLAVFLTRPAGAQRRAAARSRASMPAYQTETFPLSATPCAAKGYPMKIHFGAFVRSDGKTFVVPSGHFLRGDFGSSSIGWAVGDANQPAPDSLEIIYFSFAEDQFYEGRFAMPQQQIHAWLKQGYWDTEKNLAMNYDELTVCVLPKGIVMVWLTGISQKVLVGRFLASATPTDFRRFYQTGDRATIVRERQAEMSPAVRAEIAAGTVSARQWDEYLKKYPWQVGFNQPLVLDKYYLTYLSAEQTSYPATRELAPYLRDLLTARPRPAPRDLWLYVRDEAGHRFLLRVKAFDEAETMAAFQTLHTASPAAPLTLRLETDKYLKSATFVLTDGVKTIPLTKTVVEVIPKG